MSGLETKVLSWKIARYVTQSVSASECNDSFPATNSDVLHISARQALSAKTDTLRSSLRTDSPVAGSMR